MSEIRCLDEGQQTAMGKRAVGGYLVRAALKLTQLPHMGADGEKDGACARETGQSLALASGLQALSCILCAHRLLHRQGHLAVH